MLHLNYLYSFSGLGVGILVGLTGVGGGSLMTPLLVLLFGVHPSTAVGTDLLYAAATKTVGTAVHGYKRTVQWNIVGRLALGSGATAILTLLFLARFKETPVVSTVITSALGWALLVTAVAILFRKSIVAYFQSRMTDVAPGRARVLTILLGAILGVLVAMTSVGAGALGM